jgi:signal transduction histidine kinase
MALPSEYTNSRILIVDDEEANVLLLERMLGRAGYTQLTTTQDSREVLALVQETAPDLILLDLLMPHLDGYAVMKQLSDSLAPETYLPILVLTADVTPQALQRALSSKARDFLTKPFDQTELLLRVRNLLETRYLYRIAQDQLEQLEQLNETMQRSMSMREASLSTMSHDIGQPLAAVRFTTEMLQDLLATSDSKLRDELIGDINRIDSASNQMGEMIAELSDIGRLHMGRDLALQRRPVDLVALVREQISASKKINRKHRIEFATGEPTLQGTWDRSRLMRVVSNLISNAVKFSPKGGAVKLSISREENEAVLSVSDEGVGIPLSELEHVFDPYFRASNVAGSIEGTGIGLASVKKIVEQHGGSVAVKSVEGRGTTVTVRLPLS